MKITPRRRAILECVQKDWVTCCRIGPSFRSWQAMGLFPQPSRKELDPMLEQGYIRVVEDERNWTLNTATGEKTHHWIAILTEKGEEALRG